MDETKRELLQQLKIDRSADASDSGHGPNRWLLAVAALALLALGALGANWFSRGDLVSLSPSQTPDQTQASVAGQSVTSSATSPPATSSNNSQTNPSAAASTTKSAADTSVLDATGYVVARRQATVSSKATGKVLEVMVEEGLVVEQGQLLARLDDSIPRAQLELTESQLASSEAGLEELRIQIKQAQLDLGRTKDLSDRKLASRADLDRDSLNVDALVARLSRAQRDVVVAEKALAVQQQLLDDMEIRAPFGGVVIAKAAQPGEMISPVSAGGGFTRTGICTIVDMESLEIEVDVNESYINRVTAGQRVSATLNAYSDHTYDAQVIAIIPAADRNKATVRVRVGFLNKDARVLPDMGVRVAFLSEERE